MQRRGFLGLSVVTLGAVGGTLFNDVVLACSMPPYPRGKFPKSGMKNLTNGPLARYLDIHYPNLFGDTYFTNFTFESDIASNKASEDWEKVTTRVVLPEYYDRIYISRVELLSQEMIVSHGGEYTSQRGTKWPTERTEKEGTIFQVADFRLSKNTAPYFRLTHRRLFAYSRLVAVAMIHGPAKNQVGAYLAISPTHRGGSNCSGVPDIVETP